MRSGEFRPLLEAEARKAGLSLTPECMDRLEAHYRLLVKWSRAVRLVGSVDPATVVRRHVIESLALMPYVPDGRGSLLDIGSGNGYPAIPLKCAFEDLRLCMLEPTLRKNVFLNTVVRDLKLTDCEVLRARVDRPHDLARLGRWDCVTMRAVAAIPAVMKGAAAALRPGGRLLFMVGEAGKSEVFRNLAPPLGLISSQLIPFSDHSYIVAIGGRPATISDTLH